MENYGPRSGTGREDDDYSNTSFAGAFGAANPDGLEQQCGESLGVSSFIFTAGFSASASTISHLHYNDQTFSAPAAHNTHIVDSSSSGGFPFPFYNTHTSSLLQHDETTGSWACVDDAEHGPSWCTVPSPSQCGLLGTEGRSISQDGSNNSARGLATGSPGILLSGINPRSSPVESSVSSNGSGNELILPPARLEGSQHFGFDSITEFIHVFQHPLPGGVFHEPLAPPPFHQQFPGQGFGENYYDQPGVVEDPGLEAGPPDLMKPDPEQPDCEEPLQTADVASNDQLGVKRTPRPSWSIDSSPASDEAKAPSKSLKRPAPDSSPRKRDASSASKPLRGKRKNQEEQFDTLMTFSAQPSSSLVVHEQHGKYEDMKGRFATKTARAKFSPKRRAQVAERRKIGACFGCKMWKSACQTGPRPGQCQGCYDKMAKGHNIPPVICFKLDLEDCCVFRHSSPLHNVEGREAMRWVPGDTIILHVSMTGIIDSKPLSVRCRLFQPEFNDRVAKLVGGSDPATTVDIPAYGTDNFAEIKAALDLDSPSWCDAFIGDMRDPTSTQKVQVLGDMLYLARHYAKREPHSLTHRALQIWAGAKTTQIEKGLVGGQMLGFPVIQDPSSALYGVVPVPPILDLQIDTVLIRWMRGIQETLMKDLFDRMKEKKNKMLWFDIGMSIFVLATAAECVALEQKEFVEEMKATNEDGLSKHVEAWSDNLINRLNWSVQHLAYTFRTAAGKGFAQALFDTGPTATWLADQDRQWLQHIKTQMACIPSPDKMQYVTASGVPRDLSWITPILQQAEVRG